MNMINCGSSVRLNYDRRICRLCLEEDPIQIRIFEKEGNVKHVLNKLEACLPHMKFVPDDTQSTTICYKCLYQLEKTYDFLRQCYKSNSPHYNNNLPDYQDDKINARKPQDNFRVAKKMLQVQDCTRLVYNFTEEDDTPPGYKQEYRTDEDSQPNSLYSITKKKNFKTGNGKRSLMLSDSDNESELPKESSTKLQWKTNVKNSSESDSNDFLHFTPGKRKRKSAQSGGFAAVESPAQLVERRKSKGNGGVQIETERMRYSTPFWVPGKMTPTQELLKRIRTQNQT